MLCSRLSSVDYNGQEDLHKRTVSVGTTFLLHFDCMQLVQVYFEPFHHFQLQPERKLDFR